MLQLAEALYTALQMYIRRKTYKKFATISKTAFISQLTTFVDNHFYVPAIAFNLC